MKNIGYEMSVLFEASGYWADKKRYEKEGSKEVRDCKDCSNNGNARCKHCSGQNEYELKSGEDWHTEVQPY